MAGDNRKPWDESQVQSTEVAGELDSERTSAGRQTKTRKSFPIRKEGRDGETMTVIKNGVWLCRKVSGRWYKLKMELI